MADIFLSYAKEDREPARTIAKVLESCGWSVFWDRKITAGDDWRQVVQSELDAAGAVVVLWSEASVGSSWVIEEAERGRRRLISVRIADVVLPIGFGSVQAIDLIRWEGGRTEGVAALLDAVAKTLQRPPERNPRIPVSPSRKRGLAITAILLVALGGGALLYPILSASPPLMSQEILLDTSVGMKDNFDGKPSKLSAAVKALNDRVFPEQDNLALRAFGGPCDQGGRLLVSFGRNQADRLKSASKGVVPGGKSTLVSAVIAALSDIQQLPFTRRVVVITGHADQCDIDEPIRELKQRFDALPKTAGQQVLLEFRFIGLGIPADEASKIQQISNAVGGQAYFVDTAAQLNDVLQYVLEFEPAVAHVKSVWSIVDEVGKSMTGVAQNMNAGNVNEATGILDAGQDLYADMRPSFDSLAGLQPSVNFKRFYELASDNRALQAQAFAAGREWIRGGALSKDRQSPDYETSVKKWNERVAKWNDIVGKYNANITEMNQLTTEIVNETRRNG